MRVLIVDDEEQDILLLQEMLHRVDGLVTITTTDPGRAVELLREHRPDLVLLDLQIGGVDGVELMETLQTHVAEHDFVPMVVMSAHGDAKARERVLEAGAHDLLNKPLDVAEVVLRTRNLLRTRSLHLHVESQRAALAMQVHRHESRERAGDEHRREATARIQSVLDRRALTIAFQPIADLRSGQVVGVEALSRFDAEPRRGPDGWFAEATEVGLGADLELAAIQLALSKLDVVPEDIFVSVNISPQYLAEGLLDSALAGRDAHRIVVELTEHAKVDDYGPLLEAVSKLRALGVRAAVDDAGAGFASLQHILRLGPDMIKLDVSLTRDIDADPVLRALASSLVTFAFDVGAEIVAEGIETPSEQEALRALGVGMGQGFHLARPGPLPSPRNVSTKTADSAEES
jgi:EAL domain-containing protein (putative c-di-GMP-specific phosphodiesterase class I)/AmiR/NasT family two-component response regulator